MRVTIDRIAYGGDGVARPSPDEPIVFVPRTAVGDVAEIAIVEEKPRFRRGRLEVVETRGSERVDAPCRYYAGKDDATSCGGCHYQHLSYEAQLAAKTEQLREALRRIGGFTDARVREAVPSGAQLRYRNKGTFRWDAASSSFALTALDGQTLLPVESCPLLAPEVDRIYRSCSAAAAALAPEMRDVATGLVVRAGSTGETLAALVTKDGEHRALAERFAEKVEVTSFAWGRARSSREVRFSLIAGARVIHEKLRGLVFPLDAETFFQVNTAQAERLFGIALELARLGGSETVVDLYCGNGGIALSAAANAKRVVGVEVSRTAVERGVEAAKANGIDNVRFERGPAESVVKKLVHSRHLKPDVVFLDPPRAGIKSGLARQIAKLAPSRIVYVSCNPATLARDLKAFAECGYALGEVAPVDLFPQTYHLETVAMLERAAQEKKKR